VRILRLLPLLAAACGDEPDAKKASPDLTTHDGVTDAHIDAMEDVADVLDGIHDGPSAEAARPRMEALGKRLRQIDAAEARLAAPTPAERARLDGKLDAAAKRLEPRFARTMERLKDDSATLVLVARMMIDTTLSAGR
jgi:hypothetical protein